MNRDEKKKMEKQLAENRKTVQDWLSHDSDHKMPVTRRDFLTAGVQASIGTIAAPSIYTILDKLNRAHGADCAAAGNAALVPWVQVNFSGGWGMNGVFAPFDVNGNKLSSYTTLTRGSNPDISTNIFGNGARTYTNNNNFILGLQETASAAVLANASMVNIPVRTNDDTGNNDLDATGIVMNAGLQGVALPNTENRGFRHQSVFNINPPAPLNVSRFEDLAGALGFAGALGQLGSNQLPRFAKLVQDLSTDQARKLASLSGGENISDLVECATLQNHDNIANQSVDAINPQNDANVANIFDFNNRTELAQASIVYNALNGIAGPASLELGGYDYHGNSLAQEQTKDRTAGRLVGKVLSMAAAMNKKLFLPICSDGSVSARGTDEGTEWNSDSGARCSELFIVYDPAGAPATSNVQIGGFTNGQVADTSTTTGSDGARAMAAMVVNWAKMSGNINLALQALPPGTFSAAQLNEITVL